MVNHQIVDQTVRIVLDSNACFLEVDDKFQELFGFTDLVSASKHFLVYIHPHDIGNIAEIFNDSANHEAEFNARYRTINGNFKWMQWKGKVMHDTIELYGVDITQEANLNQFNLKLSQVIEETVDFVGMADIFGNVLYVNDWGKQMVGLNNDKDEKDLKIGFFHPKWAENEVINIAMPHAMKEGKWKGRLALMHATKYEIPVSATIISHKDDQGNIAYFSCIMRDISLQIQKEKRIESQRKEYLSLINSIEDSILIVEPESLLILNTNRSFVEKFEYKYSKVINKPITEFYSSPNRVLVEELIHDCIESEEKVEGRTIQFSATEKFYHVEVMIKPHSYFDKDVLLFVIKDISKSLRNETKLKLYAEQLKYSNEHLKKLYDKRELQSAQLSEVNQELIESITYAKRIQDAILPSATEFQNQFEESFILFKPKSIVSGDFYWFFKKEDKFIIAVGDCTGHGVPGAFMSLIGFTILNDIVRDTDPSKPNEILGKLNEQVVRTLQQKGVDFEARDGIDISICTIDLKNDTMYYAGANRNLYLVNNGEFEVIAADRQVIGGYREYHKDFKLHEFSYSNISAIYMTSDGYADQFGGKRHKKFSSKQLKTLLFDNSQKPFMDQRKVLRSSLKEWMSDSEQIDDILVLGFNPNSFKA